MKNILGKSETLKLYNKESNIVYEFYFNPYGVSCEYIYDSNGNQLKFKDSNEYSWEKTFNVNDRELTFKDSNGINWESTYDENGNELTYKHSCGISRGFDIPKYTTLIELTIKRKLNENGITNSNRNT